MMKKTTYSLAYEACEAFFAESGQMPTIKAIKPIIGVNSPSVISSAIKAWKTALSQAVRKGQGISPGTPKELQDALAGLWELALFEAGNTVKSQLAAVQAQQAALDTKEAALDDETKRIQQIVNLTEQKLQEEINYLKKEITRLSAESSVLAEQNRHYQTVANEFEKKNAVLGEEIRQEQAKSKRLEIQYDKEHDWALKRISEEKESYRLHIHNEMSRLQSEANRSKQTAELLQAKCDLATQETAAAQCNIMALERSLSDEKLKLAELTLNEAKLQKQINAKDERIRVLLSKPDPKARDIAT
jgi:chromosome segregation ATPase